ncbi:MAG: ABC transporter ATP-binding protein [Candidatus Rokubacteria bacterium]|nr:ABC transporter ATP-binding protein [Candidatus Rokubacteria bacterium]MBI3826174.1 ABC transporter ATP-binding protein [Candidatus Rokubacteria bacterium]
MARITLTGVTRRFGAAVAVDGLSLDIAQGELVSLVGGSGCGKTTTLRMIAGFERPDTGEVAFDGRAVNDVPPRKRGVGIVFQSYALFPTMTVAENVAFGLRVARWPEAKIRERVGEMVALTNLGGMEQRYANQLSGGQQQRVALARALARRPTILLLDEPLSALDAKIRLRLRGEIRKIQQDLGITTVYVTHDQEEALSIADRIAVMRDGRIEQVGRPEEIYAAPRTDFVADFIGISNLLPARVVSAAAGELEWEGTRLRARLDGRRDGEVVTLSVRPEKLAMVPDGPPAAGLNRLEGIVEVITFLGPIVRLEVAVHGRPVWVDLPHAQSHAVARKKPILLAFAPEDGVVIPSRADGPRTEAASPSRRTP